MKKQFINDRWECLFGHPITEENTYEHDGYTQCRTCRTAAMETYRGRNREERTERSKRHHRGRKSELVQYKGGKCMDCGGVFPDCVYDFEHRDPFDKSFNIGQKLHRPMEELKSEADKCDLLCSNCHRIRTFDNFLVGKRKSEGWVNRKMAIVIKE
jgi:hypothetical protein